MSIINMNNQEEDFGQSLLTNNNAIQQFVEAKKSENSGDGEKKMSVLKKILKKFKK